MNISLAVDFLQESIELEQFIFRFESIRSARQLSRVWLRNTNAKLNALIEAGIGSGQFPLSLPEQS